MGVAHNIRNSSAKQRIGAELEGLKNTVDVCEYDLDDSVVNDDETLTPFLLGRILYSQIHRDDNIGAVREELTV